MPLRDFRKGVLIFTLLLFLALWIGVIFYFSSETPECSAQRSVYVYTILKKLDTILDFSKTEAFTKLVSLFRKLLGATSEVSTVELIRSSAHFGFYAILGFVTSLLSWLWKRDFLVSLLVGTSLPAVVAILDEFNQAFHRRQSTVVDAFGDLMGAMFGTVLANLMIALIVLLEYLKSKRGRFKNIRP
uniref:VanZ-like domain-containing protein n=1 Tax=Fervidobacterium thailandense TaxID=1008305 RepID=A0A7C4RWB5_9BACT